MKRTKSPHVKRFGRLWYQLIESRRPTSYPNSVCDGCELKGDTLCAAGTDCWPGKVYKLGGVWKGINRGSVYGYTMRDHAEKNTKGQEKDSK